jgi:hypothetical protein
VLDCAKPQRRIFLIGSFTVLRQFVFGAGNFDFQIKLFDFRFASKALSKFFRARLVVASASNSSTAIIAGFLLARRFIFKTFSILPRELSSSSRNVAD